jgi:hypothetical protein
VRCERPKKKRRPPTPQTCAPPTSQACAPSPHGCAPPAGVRAPSSQACAPYPAGVCAPHQPCAPPLITGVRALTRRHARPPPRWRARPTPLACAPPADVRAPSQTCAPCPQLCAPCPPNARALIAGGRTRYIRRGPSHPHFTTLGFVSWDSFVGSLHEVVGMVQHFRFLPF